MILINKSDNALIFSDIPTVVIFTSLEIKSQVLLDGDETNVSLEHKSSLKSLEYICSNNQKYIVWVKIIIFYFMPKIIKILRSCSMNMFCKFPVVNISKLNFWLVICISKNFIWTTLKMIFSIFRFFCILRFQIFKYCPIITNHTSMERLFIQLSDDV